MPTSLKITICFFCTLFILSSCGTNGFYFENKKNYHFQESYTNDSLYIGDYVMFGTYMRRRLNYGVVRLNNDSIFSVFSQAVKSTSLPTTIQSNGRNLSNQQIISSFQSRARHISKNTIIDLVKTYRIDNSSKLVIPVVKFNFSTRSYGGPEGLTTYYITNLSLSVFILENNEIIYYKKMRYDEVRDDDEYIPYYLDYIHLPIPQERWDGLVQEVMKEYIERIVWKDC